MIRIPLNQSNLIIGHSTHPGESGKQNEDRYAVTVFRTHPQVGEIVTLTVLADGIGGNRAGEVAADLAVRVVTDVVGQGTGWNYRGILEKAIGQAAHMIAASAGEQSRYAGMGTTCAVALVAGRRLYIAYVGDSRIYLLRGGIIRQISVDHTWVQEALEYGLLTPDDARHHPNRHVVRRYLGREANVKPDFRLRLADDEKPEQSEMNQGLKLEVNDSVVLCTDGLSDVVEADLIRQTVAELQPQEAVDRLIQLACQRGGPDNITAVVMRLTPRRTGTLAAGPVGTRPLA